MLYQLLGLLNYFIYISHISALLDENLTFEFKDKNSFPLSISRSRHREERGVWIAYETLSRMLTYLLMINRNKNQGVNREVKLSKSILIKTGYQNLLHTYDFLCFNLLTLILMSFRSGFLAKWFCSV